MAKGNQSHDTLRMAVPLLRQLSPEVIGQIPSNCEDGVPGRGSKFGIVLLLRKALTGVEEVTFVI